MSHLKLACTLAQRALEEWERTLCENKAVAILEQMQAGRPALIQKDGGEMLIAIVLDRPHTQDVIVHLNSQSW